MTQEERAIMILLKNLNLDRDTAIAILLMMKKTKHGLSMLGEYLKGINPKTVTQKEILQMAHQIAKREN